VRDKCPRVVEARDGEPGKYVWLYIRELEDGSLKYALRDESADASIKDIQKPALLRWSIAQSLKECKNHLGMDHYETRSWVGWRRRVLMICIAQLFVLKMIHMFLAKKDQHLESQTVTAPVPLDEYKEVVEKTQIFKNLVVQIRHLLWMLRHHF
jgi:SRSO17 transposase